MNFKKYWDSALPINQYLKNLLQSIKTEDEPKDQYLPINKQRVKRLLNNFKLNPEVESAALNIKFNARWLIINENWCGDGAQILPVQDAIARASNGKIEARVLLREENLDLMDQFLTNGSRSIPKTIMLSEDFQLLDSLGSRPSEANSLVKRIKSDPTIAHSYNEKLHKWYAKDKQQAIQTEILRYLISK